MRYRLKLYRDKWAITWTDRGRTIRHSLRTADRAEAEIAFQGFLNDLGKTKKPAVVTVGRILEGYFEAKPNVYPRPSLLTFFRNKLPEHITEDLCKDYIKYRSNVSQATIWTELGFLSVALRWAVKEKWIDHPAPAVHRPPAPGARERWITKEEASRLVAACPSPHLKLFVEIALATCARSGAILDLTWQQVNDRFIDFRKPDKGGTNKKRATVQISSDLRPRLEEARQAAQTDYVIEYCGKPVASIKKAFARAAQRAGLEDVSPHTLRHSGATWMAMEGVEMRKISLMLGHSLQKTTERYAKYDPSYLADAVEALSRGQVVQLNQKTGTKEE